MQILTVPNSRIWWPASGEIGLAEAIFQSGSDVDQTIQTVDMLRAVWAGTITLTPQRHDVRAAMEALFAQLRGRANRLRMGHPRRRLPRGTMRGTPALSGAHSALASTLNISGTGTLLAGDLLGVGDDQVVMVTADCLAGLTAVPITPPLRKAKTAGQAVTWDWPLAVFLVTSPVRVPYAPRMSPSFSFDVVEDPQ